MSTGSRKSRGFTLIEALVATALLSIGIVGVLTALGAMAKSEAQARDRETMQRLAFQKYDEILATSQDIAAPQNGDFTDRNERRYVWSMEETPTGVDNLDAVTVTVRPANDNSSNALAAEASGLVYVPPTTTGGPTQ